MKFRNIATNALLASALAISQNVFFASNQNKVQAQPSNALVVFVNGSGDCCAGFMSEVKDRAR